MIYTLVIHNAANISFLHRLRIQLTFSMAFYPIPPSGNVGIDTLRKWTVARVKFLHDVYDCQDNKQALKQLISNGIASTNYSI